MIQLGGKHFTIISYFGVTMKLVRLIKMCLSKKYSIFHTGKHLSDNCPIQNGVKQRDALLPLLFNFLLEYMPIGRSRKTRWDWNKMGHIS
jgi:hypothetical protein